MLLTVGLVLTTALANAAAAALDETEQDQLRDISEKIEIIAGIPQLDFPERGIFKPSWREVEKSLPDLKKIGVTTIFLWAPYDCWWPKKGAKIPVRTNHGEIELEYKSFVIRDYLKPNPERGSENDFHHLVEKAHDLGLCVIGQLQITTTAPGGFIFDQHPDWVLQSVHGKPAVFWPWAITSYGYVVDKSNPDLIKFVTEVVVPHWIKSWGMDGIYIDSPSMEYCDSYIKAMGDKVGFANGCEPLTVVEGYHSPEPLVKAMKETINKLQEETGHRLSFPAEQTSKTSRDAPDDVIANVCRGKGRGILREPRVDRTLGKYYDWVMGYNFRALLDHVNKSDASSASENYAKYFDFERKIEPYAPIARFVNCWVYGEYFLPLLKPDAALNNIVLNVTAPGRTVFIGEYQVGLQSSVAGCDTKLISESYAKMIRIKKEHKALQGDAIEDALVSPKVPKLIAYNRWGDEDALTVIVNLTDQKLEATVRTKFVNKNAIIRDLFSDETFAFKDPSEAKVLVPAHGAHVLAQAR